MSAKAPSAKELIESVKIQLDTPIVLEIINCLQKRLTCGHCGYKLTSDQSCEISETDIDYLKFLGYKIFITFGTDKTEYTVCVDNEMIKKKVTAAFIAKQA